MNHISANYSMCLGINTILALEQFLIMAINYQMLKKELLNLCKRVLQDRIDLNKKAMDQTQASANEESKSSSGDKYETGRAMMQIEKENAAGQLAEALNLKRALDQIPPNKFSDIIQIGSIVITNNGNFYISVAIGKIELNGQDYFAISPVSPVGKEMINRKAGDSFIVNNRSFKVKEVH